MTPLDLTARRNRVDYVIFLLRSNDSPQLLYVVILPVL